MNRTAVGLALASLFASTQAFAWGPDGHRIVCAIAWDEMKPAVRAKVEKIIDIKTKAEFAEDCNWADLYRPDHPETAPWHYVDVPQGARSVDVARDCKAPGSCVVEQIAAQSAKAADTHATHDERAMALKFVMHFVGDIHQPLHATPDGDNGGNSIKGKFNGEDTSLHWVWDTSILSVDKRPWPQIAADLDKRVTDHDRREWTMTRPIDWANESLALSLDPKTGYIGQKSGFDFGDDFAHQHLQTVYGRLSRAGVRLASVITDILGSNN